MTDQNGGNVSTDASINVGDRVRLLDKDMTGEVVDVREFGGKKTYVVHTEKGNRVVVGARQISKEEAAE